MVDKLIDTRFGAGMGGLLTGKISSLLLTAGHGMGQSYPVRQINLLVPFPPGGTAEVIIRALRERTAWTSLVFPLAPSRSVNAPFRKRSG